MNTARNRRPPLRAVPFHRVAWQIVVAAAACSCRHASHIVTTTRSRHGIGDSARCRFHGLPRWNDDAQQDAWPSFSATCSALLARPASAAIWTTVCASAAPIDGLDTLAVRAFFERHFNAYQVLAADGEAKGLVTGYYEPLLHGSRQRDERYRVPLYGPPDDLLTVELGDLYPELRDKRVRARVDGKRVVPYWPRADIDAGKAAVSGKELLFVDDPVEAFFLQIQGSGRVRLPDGSVVRVGYADQNGQPYRRPDILVERGELTLTGFDAGHQAMGRDHRYAPGTFAENPSYVFSRRPIPPRSTGRWAPCVAGGIARSRSTRASFRSPVYVATTALAERPPNHLMLAQDTGGAIRVLSAPTHLGFREDAAQRGPHEAGGMLWLLWPKGTPAALNVIRSAMYRAGVSFQEERRSVGRTNPSTMPAWL
jgi:membrane-bound lytic murein transglycosylase A